MRALERDLGVGGGRRQAAASPSKSLPCLNSDNSSKHPNNNTRQSLGTNEGLSDYVRDNSEFLTPYHAKAVFALLENIKAHIDDIGLVYTGFLTLTFKEKVFEYKEATKRFNSFVNSTRFKALFGKWWRVAEQHKDGSWHFHLLVECGEDIRTGFDWNKYDEAKRSERRNLRAACPMGHSLRSLWKVTQLMIKASGCVGRIELLPIRSSAEGCGKYLVKYLSKGFIENRKKKKDGKVERRRLTGKGGGAIRCASARMAWNSIGGAKYREKLSRIGRHFGIQYEDLSKWWGPRWAFLLKDLIKDMPERDHTGHLAIEINQALLMKQFDQKMALSKEGDLKFGEVLDFAREMGALAEKQIFKRMAELASISRIQLRK